MSYSYLQCLCVNNAVPGGGGGHVRVNDYEIESWMGEEMVFGAIKSYCPDSFHILPSLQFKCTVQKQVNHSFINVSEPRRNRMHSLNCDFFCMIFSPRVWRERSTP